MRRISGEIIFFFLQKYCLYLGEAHLMSSHNICFLGVESIFSCWNKVPYLGSFTPDKALLSTEKCWNFLISARNVFWVLIRSAEVRLMSTHNMYFCRNKKNTFWIPLIIWSYGAKVMLTLFLLSPDIPCLCKQCRSRSVGFWRSQLIWICTVCQSECEFISTIWIK